MLCILCLYKDNSKHIIKERFMAIIYVLICCSLYVNTLFKYAWEKQYLKKKMSIY